MNTRALAARVVPHPAQQLDHIVRGKTHPEQPSHGLGIEKELFELYRDPNLAQKPEALLERIVKASSNEGIPFAAIRQLLAQRNLLGLFGSA